MSYITKSSNKPYYCDWQENKKKEKKIKALNRSKLYKHRGDFRWKNIKEEQYKPFSKNWKNIIRQTLIGNHGETTKFHVRYFEISPSGFSSFEKHRHEHVVIGIRGKGICIVGKKEFEIGFLDVLYIKPNEPHQLKNPFNEAFGFFCIVNAKRDRPKEISL